MDALPVLTTVATDAIRRQFTATPEPVRRPRAALPSWRLALAAGLERAADAIAPAMHRPAH